MEKFKAYSQAVAFLEGLNNLPLDKVYVDNPVYPKIYLRRMRYFLNLLGNPDRGMKFIHVAGTAGKGSVANLLQRALLGNGKKRVGLYTSPYVSTAIEKIKVNDKYIAPQEFVRLVNKLKPHIDQAHLHSPFGGPAPFEILFAMGLLYFQHMGCLWVVLEVGLGGRFDPTNVIKNPVITAITNIDYDHEGSLGKTLKNIAWQKMGIIKKGSRFWTSEHRPWILKMFQKACRRQDAMFNVIPSAKQKNFYERNTSLVAHIAQNLGLQTFAMVRTLTNFRLPARFETVQKRPMVILDGAHSPIKMRSVVENLKRVRFKKLLIVVALAKNKNAKKILNQIVPQADQVFITRFETLTRKCAYPPDLYKLAQKLLKKKAKLELLMDPKLALKKALAAARSDDLILVTGSFFLTGELRKLWYSEEQILKNRKSF